VVAKCRQQNYLFCFVLLDGCKSLSPETPLWHGDDNEEVRGSLQQS
jgi:hypothetical protein